MFVDKLHIMKKNTIILFASMCIVMICFTRSSVAQTTPKEIDKWYNSKVWLNGLKRKPAGTINKAELAKQYRANKARWEKAFTYLKATDLKALKPGRYPVDGDDIYINVTEGPSKNKEDVSFEAHKNYADIHCVISGKELIALRHMPVRFLKQPTILQRILRFILPKENITCQIQPPYLYFFPKWMPIVAALR